MLKTDRTHPALWGLPLTYNWKASALSMRMTVNVCVLDAELKPWLNLNSLSHTPTSTQRERCSHSGRHIIHSFGPWLGYSAALPCCGGDLWNLRIIQQTQDKHFHNLSSLAWRSKAKKGGPELPWRLNESSGVYPLNHMYHTWIRAQPQPGI